MTQNEELQKYKARVAQLEAKLLEATKSITNLQEELKEEKAKNRTFKVSISSTSDDTKKRDSSSFEKNSVSINDSSRNEYHACNSNFKGFKNTRRFDEPSSAILKRTRSSDIKFRNHTKYLQHHNCEDQEFEKLEAQAMYEAKMEQIF